MLHKLNLIVFHLIAVRVIYGKSTRVEDEKSGSGPDFIITVYVIVGKPVSDFPSVK